jgi:DNA-binding transcriptional LysR family regulator
MTTFRELEAFVASVDMGSFKGAARSLNTSQSAISRLIQEFEERFERPLFNRAQRSAKLTVEGQEALRVARVILRQRAVITERFCDASLIEPTLRFGVTELAAITWLPDFAGKMRERYARLQIEVEVGSSPELHERVRDGKLDIALVLDVVRSKEMVRIPVGKAQVGWFCAPGLGVPEQISVAELEQQTLLIQGTSTGAGRRLSMWFKDRSIEPRSLIQSDSLMALAGMAAAGLGIASLPKALAVEAVERGRLKEVGLSTKPPELVFVAIARIDAISDFHRSVIGVARECCNFELPYHLRPRAATAEASAC